MVDDLSAFAEELVPEAFTRRHTAYRVHRVDPLWGESGFSVFIESLLRYAVLYRCSCGAFPIRMVVIEGGDGIAWYWADELDGPASWMVERVRRDAYPIPDPWLFAIELMRPEPDPLWVDGVTAPLGTVPPPPDLRWMAVWYAEARGRGMAMTRAGIVDLEYLPDENADRVLAEAAIPVRRDPLTRDFHRILYAHPARKQHPLRRRR